MRERKSGILLHITSLPGAEGIGTLGKEAYAFVDFLKETGQKLWQILPLGPIGGGNSPYQCYSAFAGEPLLIDLELLLIEGLLSDEDFDSLPRFKKSKVDFKKVSTWKQVLLKKAFQQFQKIKFDEYRNEYNHFLNEHDWWLNDYALFISVRGYFGGLHWIEWDRGIKFRNPEVVREFSERLSQQINFEKFLQFMFFRQWNSIKHYANKCEIQIVGDIPLYVSGDSADVWANSDLFLLDENLDPTFVGGVPPDYFSKTGQLWGNPVFDWNRMKKRDYDWWMARLHFNLNMFNVVRIDHFRGLESYWSVPATEETAINGKWEPAGGFEMLSLIKSQLGTLPFIAEDLGRITPEVDQLRNRFNLPGMKILQFAFSTDAANRDLPHNYDKNCVVYSGTHDNNTTLGWLNALEKEEKQQVEKYISNENQVRQLMEMAMASVADTAILTMQDVLELDEKSRMNTPGTTYGNWDWRFQWKQLKAGQRKFLKEVTQKFNRS